VTGVEMKVDDIDDARAIKQTVANARQRALHTMDWEELNHGLFTALRIQQIGMSAVLALIIVVAAFTVVATLIMVVLDKKKEIAVLKAMGATDEAILRIFLYQGSIIGVLGTTLGLCSASSCAKACSCTAFPWIRRCISSHGSPCRPARRVPADGGHRHRHLRHRDHRAESLRCAPPTR
jgi:lipoprotein-releasing system permease protein